MGIFMCFIWQHINQLVVSHPFIRFTSRRRALPVVRVKGSQTWCSFLFFAFLFALFLLSLDFIFFAVLTYLAPGCGDDTSSIIINRNFTVVLVVTCVRPDYHSHVSSCFFLLGVWGTGFWEPSSSSSSLSSHLFFFGLDTSTTGSVSWVETSCKCFSAKAQRVTFSVILDVMQSTHILLLKWTPMLLLRSCLAVLFVFCGSSESFTLSFFLFFFSFFSLSFSFSVSFSPFSSVAEKGVIY